jgi:hypothetical protein
MRAAAKSMLAISPRPDGTWPQHVIRMRPVTAGPEGRFDAPIGWRPADKAPFRVIALSRITSPAA